MQLPVGRLDGEPLAVRLPHPVERRGLKSPEGIDQPLLALPVPFDNLLPALAILFFCLALMEGDGVMAMLGWLFTIITLIWTAVLLTLGHMLAEKILRALF